MFQEAARTAARTAELVAGSAFLEHASTEGPDTTPQSAASSGSLSSVPLIRERTIPDESQVSDYESTACRGSLADRICSRTVFSNTLQSGRRMTVGGPTVSPQTPLLSTCAVPR